MSDYRQYLSDIHSRHTAPESLLTDVIKDVSNSPIASKRRIVAGEENEVYDITLENGTSLIIRVSRSKEPEFEREHWAIEECKKVGVPVPGMLLIKSVVLNDTPATICVQKKLAGSPLERGDIDFRTLDKAQLRNIINQAGEILSRIHSIKTYGFGPLDGQGAAKFSTFKELMAEHIEKEQVFLDAAKSTNLDSSVISKVFDILRSYQKFDYNPESILAHGDFGPKHIMIADNKITGVLDFGQVNGHSPINDFAKWDYWFSDEIPLEWLKEGYSNQAIFNDDFSNILYWITVNNALEDFEWYIGKNYQAGIENAKSKLIELTA
jgi:aminoglycoside phosphotransferase (APT) family kinase protein